jgi:hypothetical protein
LNLFSSYRGFGLGQVSFDLAIWVTLSVSEVYGLYGMMTLFSSPAYATMLSNRGVPQGQKAKSFL